MTVPTVTNDNVVGTWSLWVRTDSHPATATYQAVFVPSATDPSQGTVTVTGGAVPSTGTWSQNNGVLVPDENVNFDIPDPAGSGKEFKCSGHMVGAAMGGGIGLIPTGAWAASKISD